MEVFPSIEFRLFRPTDQDAVQHLILAGLEEHWGWLDITRNPDLDHIAVTYAEATFITAWQGETLIACGALIPRSTQEAEIVRMPVARDFRRSGLGRRILSLLLEKARSAGFKRVILETTATWQGVVAFYESCGFFQTYTQDGDVYFVMELS